MDSNQTRVPHGTPSFFTAIISWRPARTVETNMKESKLTNRIKSESQASFKDKSNAGWWFQPIWKILVKVDHLPSRDENKNIWKHHLEWLRVEYLQQYLCENWRVEWFPQCFFVINTTVNHQVKPWSQRHCFQARPTHVAQTQSNLFAKGIGTANSPKDSHNSGCLPSTFLAITAFSAI